MSDNDMDMEQQDVQDSDVDSSGQSRQWDCPLGQKAHRTYREQDFRPTVKDPRVKDGLLPLAAYWPVYVSNFRLRKKETADTGSARSVHRYFASFGLPSFYVHRLRDFYHFHYQMVVGLHDFIVYFCTKADAKRAIQWCDRASYFGYKLNACCGRTAELLSKVTAFCVTFSKEYQYCTVKEMEKFLGRFGEVRTITKNKMDEVTVATRSEGIGHCIRHCIAARVCRRGGADSTWQSSVIRAISTVLHHESRPAMAPPPSSTAWGGP